MYLRCVAVWSARYLASCRMPQMKEEPRRDSQGKPRKQIPGSAETPR